MRLAIQRLARAATIAAAIVVSSGSLVTGRPLLATLGDVAFKLTAALSEVEEVRRKITEPHARIYWVRST
jgi:hypothetical protein